MSVESAVEFLKDFEKKPEIKKIIDKAEADFDSKEARREYISKEAKKHGYNFTANDLETIKKVHNSDFSDDDLENVAGGFGARDAYNGVKQGAEWLYDQGKTGAEWLYDQAKTGVNYIKNKF
jgi:predicted ribosomally synthesized peptide with nif11-like leader